MPDLNSIEIAFWAVVLLMLYTLNGYPLLLGLFALLRKDRSPSADEFDVAENSDCPPVSFIVAAFNEEKNISAKIDNLLAVQYPSEKIEFVIGSDASHDDTDRILNEATALDSRIKYFRLDRRRGKIAVLRQAVERASGSILVFTDCSVLIDADIMPKILAGFSDSRVGMISSRDIWIDDSGGSPQSQHQYIDYEMTIRRRESRLNSLVSVSGSFFAVRRELFRKYGDDLADDFALPLAVYRQGYRVVHRHDLTGYVPMVKSSGAELTRRTRIITAGLRTVMANASLLNPLRYPVFAWQLWSHKMLKWLFPFMALANLALAAILWDRAIIYPAVIIGWAVVIALGLLGFGVRATGLWSKPFRVASFFLLSMAATLKAWYNLIAGSQAKTWEPTHR